MSALVPLSQSNSDAIAVQDGEILYITPTGSKPVEAANSERLLALLNHLERGQVSQVSFQKFAESVLEYERSRHAELATVANTANQAALQLAATVKAQNETIQRLAERHSESQPKTQVKVTVHGGGYYSDPMPAIGLLFFATVIVTGWFAMISPFIRQSQPQPQSAVPVEVSRG